MEFTLVKSRAMTLSRSPQYRAVMDEKLLSPLFPVGVGGGGGWGAVARIRIVYL